MAPPFWVEVMANLITSKRSRCNPDVSFRVPLLERIEINEAYYQLSIAMPPNSKDKQQYQSDLTS
jgi:hypothetical protein